MKRNKEMEKILTGIPDDGESLSTKCRFNQDTQKLVCESELTELDTGKIIRKQRSEFDIDPDR